MRHTSNKSSTDSCDARFLSRRRFLVANFNSAATLLFCAFNLFLSSFMRWIWSSKVAFFVLGPSAWVPDSPWCSTSWPSGAASLPAPAPASLPLIALWEDAGDRAPVAPPSPVGMPSAMGPALLPARKLQRGAAAPMGRPVATRVTPPRRWRQGLLVALEPPAYRNAS